MSQIETRQKSSKKQPLPSLKNCHNAILKIQLLDKTEYRIVDHIKWWETWLLCAIEKYNSMKLELDKDIPTDSNIWEDDSDGAYWPQCLGRLLMWHSQLDMTNPFMATRPVVEITFGVEWDAWVIDHYERLHGKEATEVARTMMIRTPTIKEE